MDNRRLAGSSAIPLSDFWLLNYCKPHLKKKVDMK